MQRRHRGEYIAALRIEPCENMHIKKGTPTPQPRRIARRMRIERKYILLHIPGRSRGTDIVHNKTNQVDDQEAEGKTKERFLILVEQIACKSEWQRDPTEIEEAGQDVQQGLLMHKPEFIGGEPPAAIDTLHTGRHLPANGAA